MGVAKEVPEIKTSFSFAASGFHRLRMSIGTSAPGSL
jgi:hypothetical protein